MVLITVMPTAPLRCPSLCTALPFLSFHLSSTAGEHLDSRPLQCVRISVLCFLPSVGSSLPGSQWALYHQNPIFRVPFCSQLSLAGSPGNRLKWRFMASHLLVSAPRMDMGDGLREGVLVDWGWAEAVIEPSTSCLRGSGAGVRGQASELSQLRQGAAGPHNCACLSAWAPAAPGRRSINLGEAELPSATGSSLGRTYLYQPTLLAAGKGLCPFELRIWLV